MWCLRQRCQHRYACYCELFIKTKPENENNIRKTEFNLKYARLTAKILQENLKKGRNKIQKNRFKTL